MPKEPRVSRFLFWAAAVGDVVVTAMTVTLLIPLADAPWIWVACILGGWLALRVAVLVQRRVRRNRVRASS